METMKEQVLQKALGMLRVLGCQYAVVDPEGVKHGDLEVVLPKPKIKRQRTGFDYKPFYKERVDNMQPSDKIEEFTAPEGLKIEQFRSVITAYCTAHWGKDSYSTQVKDGKILLMRYA